MKEFIMTVSASVVKELREKTNAGMMDCKKALEESGGDLDKAVKILREKGIASAAKKAGRSAAEGLVGFLIKGSKGVLIELNCETDFVARTQQFKDLLEQLTEVAWNNVSPSSPEQAAQTFLSSSSGDKTVEEIVKEAVASMGENMQLPRIMVLEASATEVLGSYLHMDSKLAALVLLECGAGNSDKPEVVDLVRELAMQVAGHLPPAEVITRDQISREMIDREKEIAMNQARATGKPENILEKIAEGKLNKVFQEITLMDQVFVKDLALEISALVDGVSKKINAPIKVKAFYRMKVGEKN
jgi:elongation factor Ts